VKKATRQFTKLHNTRLILKAIYNNRGEISRAELSRLTQLTPATVSDLVGDLVGSGLIKEVGVGASTGGKPPILLSFDPDSRQMVCIDLSGDGFLGAIVNLQGDIITRKKVSAQNCVGQEALEATYALIDELIQACSAPILGIGVGTPGLVNVQKGIIRKALNLGWHELPLKSLLQERYHHTVHIANDCHVAALAEYAYGSGREEDNLLVIKISQGIGCGIILNGAPYYGDGFGAGEIGHITVTYDGPRCACGNVGCLEALASTRALIQNVRLQVYKYPDSSLYNIPPNEIGLPELISAFQKGDAFVTDLISQCGKYIAKSIAYLVGLLNVHHIVIAGDFEGFGPYFLDVIRHELPYHVLPVMAEHAELTYSPLGENIVLLGAAALVLVEELDLP
jgi:N-acetylglucosamine repressor